MSIAPKIMLTASQELWFLLLDSTGLTGCPLISTGPPIWFAVSISCISLPPKLDTCHPYLRLAIRLNGCNLYTIKDHTPPRFSLTIGLSTVAGVHGVADLHRQDAVLKRFELVPLLTARLEKPMTNF